MFSYVKRALWIVLMATGLMVMAWGATTAAQDLAQNPTPTPAYGPVITAAPATSAPPTSAAATAAPPMPPSPTKLLPTLTPTPTGSPGTPTISPTPLPTYRADVMGVQMDPNLSQEDFEFGLWLAKRLGIKWIKFQFAWDLLEPQQGTLSDLFYTYRIYVQRADAEGFNVMISLVKAPDWARSTAEEEGPPNDPQALANFITRMMGEVRADLYGNSYFDAIEVWNEPNLRREWNGGTISGAEYMRYFNVAYNAIRAGEGGQHPLIVTAGLAPTGINDGTTAVDDRQFLRQMYDAGLNNGAYQNIAVGVHPYGAANPPDARCCVTGTPAYNEHPSWFFLDTLEDYHAIMQEYGDSTHQLWATEFGWGTWDGFMTEEGEPAPPPADPPYIQWLTEDQQANYVMRAFEIGQSLPYVGVMMLWNLNFGGQKFIDLQDPQASYSLLKPGVDPLRPAFKLLEAAPKTTP